MSEVLPNPCINANVGKGAVRVVRASDDDSYQTNERACGEGDGVGDTKNAGWKECLGREKERKGTRVSVPVFKIQLHVRVYYTELRECVVERLKREGGGTIYTVIPRYVEICCCKRSIWPGVKLSMHESSV